VFASLCRNRLLKRVPLALIIRVLYRLRFLSEQAPFESATFSYSFPLLEKVLSTGGVEASTEDEALEQVSLALSIIQFHAGECASTFNPIHAPLTTESWKVNNTALPRLETLRVLIHVIRTHFSLGKEASSALIDLGEAMAVSATRQETDALLQSTLSQESYARSSCLQALQVRTQSYICISLRN